MDQTMARGVGMAMALGLVLALGAGPAHADSATPHGFEAFCDSWMAKLRAREVRNAVGAQLVQAGSAWVGTFTGYGKKAVECRARPTGSKAAPFVGKLVYEELVYRVTGRSPTQALLSQPEVTGRTRVLEIFKFDGRKWVY